MAFAQATSAFDTSWLHGLTGLFIKPARLQIAALCVRDGGAEPEVLLVSTRDTGRMILPKGWPEADRPAFETAVLEAYEEAGIVGKAVHQPMGSFRSFKGLSNGLRIRTKVLVFKVKVESQLDKFPELGQRKCVWLPLSKAIEKADEPALRRFLKRQRAKIF
jgi:8-oxo-dGTP pyrophosphatase MutT (NUDIX family)